ncbi:MAG: class I SAM-dependent rRNA methyltransferase [Fibrobacteres bacterium]|nr:class I SAM-dependent rRNA methyltransferase [Fibrobacterota bacterium]
MKSESSAYPVLSVRGGRETPFKAGHPWVFSGALANEPKGLTDGDSVELRDARGGFIGYGLYNSKSQIRVRIYSWKEGELLSEKLFASRIANAVSIRKSILKRDWENEGCRLIFSETDLLTGLTVDTYGRHISIQITSYALYQKKETILNALVQTLNPLSVTLRTEKGIKDQEGLEIRDSVLYGTLPEGNLTIKEHDLQYALNLREGHKTGFYLDQRENRFRVRDFAAGRKALDVCCYSGGFTMNLLKGGASTCTAVDASQAALDLASENVKRNSLSASFVKGDAFKVLEEYKAKNERFGLIVLDPPRFAQSGRGVDQALKGYAGLNGLALSLLEPGGILVTCSCSGRVTPDLFRAAIRDAAVRENCILRILEERGAAPDHAVHPAVPETEYLKCFICVAE